MDLQNLAIAIVVLALVELALDVSKKAPLWLSRQSVASFRHPGAGGSHFLLRAAGRGVEGVGDGIDRM
jgi:hypothetical protein